MTNAHSLHLATLCFFTSSTLFFIRAAATDQPLAWITGGVMSVAAALFALAAHRAEREHTAPAASRLEGS